MVPMFKRMYAGLGEDLFWLTRALVKLSDSLRFNPEAWILGTLFSGAIIIFVYRMFGWYWFLNLIPGGKRLQQSVQMLFYSRSMEIMLLTGVHLQEALALAEEMFRSCCANELLRYGKQLIPESPCVMLMQWFRFFRQCL